MSMEDNERVTEDGRAKDNVVNDGEQQDDVKIDDDAGKAIASMHTTRFGVARRFRLQGTAAQALGFSTAIPPVLWTSSALAFGSTDGGGGPNLIF